MSKKVNMPENAEKFFFFLSCSGLAGLCNLIVAFAVHIVQFSSLSLRLMVLATRNAGKAL